MTFALELILVKQLHNMIPRYHASNHRKDQITDPLANYLNEIRNMIDTVSYVSNTIISYNIRSYSTNHHSFISILYNENVNPEVIKLPEAWTTYKILSRTLINTVVTI